MWRHLLARMVLIAVAAMVVGLPLAPAAWADRYRDCFRKAADNRLIGGCTQIINSGGESRKNHVLAYTSRGIAYKKLKKYRRAIQDYNEAIRLRPRYAIAHHNRGNAYFDLRQYRRAIQDYNEALRLNPGIALSYYQRGNAYDKLGRKQEAIQNYRAALRLNSNLGQAREGLKRLAAGTRDPQIRSRHESDKRNCLVPSTEPVVIAACSRWIASGKIPSDLLARAHYMRALAYFRLNRLHQAIEEFGQVIRLNPRHSKAYEFRGMAYQRSTWAEKRRSRTYPSPAAIVSQRRALRDFNECIRLGWRLPRTYYYRGVSFADLGQHRSAIADFNEAIRKNPRFAVAYGLRGGSYTRLGKYRRAIADFDKEISLLQRHPNVTLPIAHYNRGYAYEKLGRKQEAIRDYRAALRFKPNLRHAREGLKRLGVRPLQRPKRWQPPDAKSEPPNGGAKGRAAPQTQPLCRDVGGYEAYMKRTGKVCRLD